MDGAKETLERIRSIVTGSGDRTELAKQLAEAVLEECARSALPLWMNR